MSSFLLFAFLFCMGSMAGWVIEVLFRKRFSASNPKHRWVNPGFLTGPYLPLYGFGLMILYVLASVEPMLHIESRFLSGLVLFCLMAAAMTAIEYIAGISSIKIAHVRLWDYSGQWGNIQGIICPLFTFFWGVLGLVYYLLIHPYIQDALLWLSQNLAFSFFIGMFYGIFILDLCHKTQVMVVIRRFAAEKQIVVRYEDLKEHIRERNAAARMRVHFLFDLHSDRPFRELLGEYYEHGHQRLVNLKDNISKKIDKI